MKRILVTGLLSAFSFSSYAKMPVKPYCFVNQAKTRFDFHVMLTIKTPLSEIRNQLVSISCKVDSKECDGAYLKFDNKEITFTDLGPIVGAQVINHTANEYTVKHGIRKFTFDSAKGIVKYLAPYTDFTKSPAREGEEEGTGSCI